MIKKRPDGKWLVNVTAGGRTGIQAKRVFATQKEAKEFELWFKAQHHENPEWKPSKRESRRLSELIGLWWSSHGQTLSAGKDTHARLTAMCARMANPVATHTRERFDEYRQSRIQEGVSLATINREHAYLRSVFGELKRLGQWTEENPLSSIRAFKIKENELTFLSLEQIAELLEELKASRNPHAVMVSRVCLCTGARWSEANDLLKSQLQGHRVQFARTKSGKARALPISPTFRDELSRHMKDHPTGTERLFEPCYTAFIKALDRTGIKLPDGQATHVLRHTFASHFMMRGGNILALQRALGHSSLTMTMRYAHLSPDHMEEVVRLNPLAPQIRQGWSDAAAKLIEQDDKSH